MRQSRVNARWILARRIALALVTLAVVGLAPAASADAFVYWANMNGGTIGRASLDGNPQSVDQSFITGASAPYGVADDGAHLYWTNTTTGTIGRADIAATGVVGTPNQSFISGAVIPGGVAADAASPPHVYWTNIGANSIGRANLDSSGAVSGVNQPLGLLSIIVEPLGMAVDSNFLYWTFLGVIGRSDHDGQNVQRPFIQPPANDDVEGVAVNEVAGGSATVYWTNRIGGTIGRADVSANGTVGTPNNSFITGASGPIGVAVDANHIYWANSGTGTIGRADIDASGDVSNIDQSFISGANNPAGVAVDSLTTPGPGPPPPPPPPTIQHLIDEVTEQGLPAGIERSLLAKLEGAQRKVDAGHTGGACGSLGAYINEVKAQNGKKLETTYAEALIVDAMAVREALGCDSN
jgi:sugar lactone lactonase YvrE